MHHPDESPLPPGSRSSSPRPPKPRRQPKLSLHKGSGQARVVIAGKQHYLGKYGSPEAHEKYARLMREWREHGDAIVQPAPTVAQATYLVRDLTRDYLKYLEDTGRYRKNGEPTSSRAHIEIVFDSFLEFCGATPVNRLSEALLVQWRDRLEGNHKLTREGINRKVRMLIAVLRWGKARGHVPKATWVDCSGIDHLQRGQCGDRPERGRPRRAPSVEEIGRVIAACTSRHVAGMLRLQALTGMRPGEVAAMRWQDIDQKPVLTPDGIECWTYRVASPKTAHHGLTVKYYLVPEAQQVLREFPGLPGAYVFSVDAAMHERRQQLRANRKTPVTDCTRRIDGERTRVFHSKWSTHAYRHHVERACRVAGVERFTPHEVRHAVLTAVANEQGVGAAQALANHASPTVTARYVHRDDSKALAALSDVRRRFGAG